MMTRPALYLLCSCFAFSQASGQQTKPVEPELMGVVYLLDSTDQSLKPLSKEPAKVTTARKGLTGARGVIQIPGPSSSFRLKSGKNLEFVVRASNPESFQLHTFTKKGKGREAVVSSAKGKFFGGVNVQQVGVIELDMSKYGESSYRFLVKALEPGEYGFLVSWSVFDFAVDPN